MHARHIPRQLPVAAPSTGRVRTLLAFTLAQLGKPYRMSTAGPSSYDCSGLVMAGYSRVGIRLPHQTGGIARYGRTVGRGDLRAGDIVFTSSGHVGIYLGAGLMVHAPHTGQRVEIAAVYAFWSARRLL